MLLTIPDLLTATELKQCREALENAEWVDGRVTAGYQGNLVKKNRQLPEDAESTRLLGDLILRSLERHPRFISAALPAQVYPPLFNCYEGGEHFGTHVDNALRLLPGGGKLRTDISATLFLSAPEDYDGGELLIEDTYGTHAVKLPAGHLVLYPATSLHRVNPVTRGARLASFFWVQSLVRDDAQRTLLFDLDTAIQTLHQTGADETATLQLIGCYHNLLRQWGTP